ncbi:hypothetical protein SSX86_024161 [Deinandra increscens subsp. villosa]|uniref:Uncharacterized protein n=1 Tax=Deinandra increscens subsp. villosa TaxID=3103831 RepID=A0AAP0CP11_9ASTR
MLQILAVEDDLIKGVYESKMLYDGRVLLMCWSVGGSFRRCSAYGVEAAAVNPYLRVCVGCSCRLCSAYGVVVMLLAFDTEFIKVIVEGILSTSLLHPVIC